MKAIRVSALLLIGVVLAGRPSLGGPAWDPVEIADLASQSAQLSLVLARLTDLQGQLRSLSALVGPEGIPSLAPETLARSIHGIPALPPPAAALQAPVAGKTATAVQTMREQWRGEERSAATDGLSLALQSFGQAQSAPDRADRLVAQARSAQNLRADTQADSAACVALLGELVSLQMVLALLLEQDAAHELRKGIAIGARE